MAILSELWQTLQQNREVFTGEINTDHISGPQERAVEALRNSLRSTTDHYKAAFKNAVEAKSEQAVETVSQQLAYDIFDRLGLKENDSKLLQLHKTALVRSIGLSQQQSVLHGNQYHGPEHFLEAIIDCAVMLELYGNDLTATQQAATLVGMATHDYMYSTKSKDIIEKGAEAAQESLVELGYDIEKIPIAFIQQAIEDGSPAEYIASKYNKYIYADIITEQREFYSDYPSLLEELADVSTAILHTDIGNNDYKNARAGDMGKMSQIMTTADIFRAVLAPEEGLTGSAKLVIEGDQDVTKPVKQALCGEDNNGLLTGLKAAYRNFHKFVVNNQPENGSPYGLPLFKLCAALTMQELDSEENISIDSSKLQALELAVTPSR